MKVTQEQKFQPVTITLESQVEVETLWTVLNVPGCRLAPYAPVGSSCVSESTLLSATAFRMFRQFDDVVKIESRWVRDLIKNG